MDKSMVAKQIWLLYFNQTLYERQIITPYEYRKIHSLILSKDKTASE